MDKRPRILILGHARHGKDTVAQMISDRLGLKFSSSSEFVGRKAIWPYWGKERYDSFEAMFEDRVNYRSTWGDLIEAYNTPDASRTAREMLEEGNDMYVGLRRVREYSACMKAELFDVVIWVDGSKRHPDEPMDSMEMNVEHANLVIDNNGTEEDLSAQIDNLTRILVLSGYQFPGPAEEELPELGSRLEWTDKPVNAIQVLDHGFFEVKEVMGSDNSIAESARMSYGRGTKKVNNDPGLINYLVRNHHTSPLEMGEIKFHMRLPIFVMRQLVRHRTANLNEYSGRYSEMVRLFYTPELSKIMCQSDGPNKQMSGEPLQQSDAEAAQRMIYSSANESFDDYEWLLAKNVSRETARIVLPLNTYTEVVWKLDVSNLIKFLYLRDDDHAQYEIRVYARFIAEAVEHFFPAVYAAYLRERESVKLTPLMIECLIRGETLEGLAKSEQAQIAKLLDEYN
jgi:thymidylate synthase (FAD)